MKTHFEIPQFTSPCAVAIGTFDGVHLGHQAVIGAMMAEAHQRGLPAVVVSFQNHPLSVLAPDRLPPLLCTPREKALALEALNPDAVILLPFDKAFSQLSPEEFVSGILQAKLQAAYVTVGFNFHFGFQAQGTPERLRELGQEQGFDVAIHPAFQAGGEAVSSSRIRKLLEKGALEECNALLGQPYLLMGKVIRGQGIAATVLGVPTANLDVNPVSKRLPPHGVYACQVKIPGQDKPFWGILNSGMRPTFSGVSFSLEVFIMDFEGDLYEQELQIRLLHFIRPERRFEGPEQLKAQIQTDIHSARALLGQTV